MGTILRISGKEFNVDKFDIGWNLMPTTIHRKDDLTRKSNSKSRKIEFSQLIFDVSKADYSNLKEQINDTIIFLKEYSSYLDRLSKEVTIETITIDFAFNSRIDGIDVEVQTDYFPPELMRLLGSFNIGIVLTQWPYESHK